MDIASISETISNLVTVYAIKFIGAVLIFIIGKWLSLKISKLTAKLLEKNKIDSTLTDFLENIIYYALLIVVIIAAAGQLGINTASFLTIVGAAGLAIGLALKDSLSNFASGVMLILFRPFKTDDYVTAGGVSGTVVNIGIFNTILNTPDNKKIIVPNSSITASVITNVTANDIRRVDITVGISYDDDIKKAKNILEKIIQEEERILETPEPRVAVSELGDSSVNFVFRPWTRTDIYWDLYFDLIEKIKVTFDEQDITIPYPQQDVHLFNSKKNQP